MDNNFSAQVKEIISYSREEALRLGNDFIGTEHLLLGLIRDEENTAIKVLKQLNVDLYELRKEIELEDDNTAVVRTHIDDEYAHAGEIDPKLLITTSRDPSSRLTQFSKVNHALDAACCCWSCGETSR